MSISDYVMTDDIVVIGKGRGWSIWHEPSTDRVRFDVFAKNTHKSVPAIARFGLGREFAMSACLKFWRDAFLCPEIEAPVRNLRRFCDARWPA